MMMSDGFLHLALPAATLGFVGLAAIPSLHSLVSQIRSRAPKDNFYEDADGSSTPEDVGAFSSKRPKTVILALSGFGLATSIAISVLSTLHLHQDGLTREDWLLTATWAIILGQGIAIAAHHSSVQSQRLGLFAMLSALVTSALVVWQVLQVGPQLSVRHDAGLMLRIVNILLTISLTFASSLLPRRPDVNYKGRKVDGQWTVSILSRYTWSWAIPILKLAKKKGDLDEKDIPQPDHTLRAGHLIEEWHKTKHSGGLLYNLVSAYRNRFILQWTVAILRCFIGLGPFWTMLRLIQSLEKRAPGEAPTSEMWSLIILLGVLTLSELWVDGWTVWYAISMMLLPVRAQLASLVFEKALKRKNVKSAEKTKESPEAEDGTTKDNADSKDAKKKDDVDAADSESEANSTAKSRQSVVNLVGVDTRRISDFAMWQVFAIGCIGKLLIYSAFLVNLIGWIPFGAGVLAWAVVIPVNYFTSRVYMKYQEQLMKIRDEKLAAVNETLAGIRQIKFSALERQWESRILNMRAKEIKMLVKLFLLNVVLSTTWVASPILLAATSLATYAAINGTMTPSVAFVSIGIFKSLEISLSILPELVGDVLDCLTSARRIDAYLKGPDMEKILSQGPEVAFENASIAWPVDKETPDDERFILNNLNFAFPAGELSVIAGKTGTGKSLLLSAILGEVDLLGGSIYVPPTAPPLERNDGKAHLGNWILPGSVAYVAQTPWLESASFRDNILFGLPFIQSRYDQVLDVCALTPDLKVLVDGDKTELGANGINLSGGQKWRVTLARAIYSRAEILVLDDIFSAVDAHVGRQIFDKCIAGDICKGRTRILVTHHVSLVQPQTKFLVELGEGSVLHSGLITELDDDGTLSKIKSHGEEQVQIQASNDATAVNSEDASEVDADKADDEDTPPLQKTLSKDAKKFIEDESRAKGAVKKHIYATYMSSSGGWFFWIICGLFYIIFEASNIGRGWWIKIWTGQTGQSDESTNVHGEHGFAYAFALQNSPQYSPHAFTVAATAQHPVSFYLWIYVAIAVFSGVMGTVKAAWSFNMSIKASKALYKKILFAVIRTPLRWVDTVPVGRILNRLTADFEIIDNRLTFDLSFIFSRGLALVGVCVASTFVSGYILPLALALILIASYVGRLYMDAARPLKRLDSNAKSPVFELFNSTLAGVSTLRAYSKNHVYTERMHDLLDLWDIKTSWIWVLNRWMGFLMALVGTTFTTLTGIIVLLAPNVDAALAGFTLSFALDFSVNMIMAIRAYSSLELDMNAAERVIEYAELQTESLDGEQPGAAWPSSGAIEVEDLVVGYAPDLPPVLNGVSFNVGNNERIGVVGRTGAGKSSLTLALFRFLEARSGKITIDGIDISKITLQSLRSRLAIIPQDPVLFSGTIRSNLDPFDDYTDAALRDCLSRVHLVDSVPATPANEPSSSSAPSTIAPKNVNIFRDLSSGISESGGNLSQGQRQLLCIARAIIARPKVMVLDEATSAVDMATDTLIQRSIREEFTDSTLIVIAHRLSTIADFDRILVLSNGSVAEFGTPQELWNKEGGLFRDMCEHSGEKDKLRHTILGL